MADPDPRNQAPMVFIKRRTHEGAIDRSVRICRYWKSKETGAIVEVRGFRRVVPENVHRVIYFDAAWPVVEQSTGLKDFKENFEPVGNFSTRY